MTYLIRFMTASALAFMVPAEALAASATYDDVHKFISSKYSVRKADTYSELVVRKAQEYDIPPSILAALIGLESGYNRYETAPGSPPCVGLMQIKTYPDRVRAMKGRPYDPEQNVDWGCHYLKGLYYRVGKDWHRALVAYNMGPYYVVNRGYTRTRYSTVIMTRAEAIHYAANHRPGVGSSVHLQGVPRKRGTPR